MGELLGLLLGSSLGSLWVIGLLLYGTLPVMALVVTLNIRKMRIELQRIHNTLESQGTLR
jgi:hypothetical protein